MGNIKKNEENILIKISSKEAKELNKLGVNYGENGISHTHSHHKTYFLCESKKNMYLISKLREKNIVNKAN
jgi:hypothetical protein